MSRPHAQYLHANDPQEAIDAYLHKYDIDNSPNGNVDLGTTFGDGTDMYWGHGGNSPGGDHGTIARKMSTRTILRKPSKHICTSMILITV